MKAEHKRKPLTLGELIASVYGVYGKRRARGIMKLLFDAHIVAFSRHHPMVFS
jgi:hypothetical protein